MIIIRLCIARLFQAFLSNTNPFQTNLFVLISTTPPGQCGPRSNGNEGVLHTTQISRTRVPSPNAVLYCIKDTILNRYPIFLSVPYN